MLPAISDSDSLSQASSVYLMEASLPRATEEEQLPPLFKKRGLNRQTIRKRAPKLPTESGSSASNSTDDEDRSVKRRRKTGGLVTSSKYSTVKTEIRDLQISKFDANRTGRLEVLNDATKQSDWFDEGRMNDSRAPSLLGSTRSLPTKETLLQDKGIYKGITNYQSFTQKNPNAPFKQVGPIKAPTNIRAITVTDYSPDVCKDVRAV